jgi:hypothetical protein
VFMDINVDDTLRTKRTFSRKSLVWFVLVIVSAVLVSTVLAVVHFLRVRAPSQPPAVVLTLCQTAHRGTHRISADFGTQFDAPEARFTVHGRLRDMPPGTLYTVTPKNGATKLIIWRDDDIFRELKNAAPVFSKVVKQRDIHNSGGALVGRDRWGYLKDGERWRYVTFSNGDAVGYPATGSKEATLFDEIISSACSSTDPQPSPIN